MKCLVTGGAGFIGSHLVDALVSQKHTVVILDNLRTGNLHNIFQHQHNEEVTVVQGSITDDLSSLFEQHVFDVVFHLAAIVSVQESIHDPISTHAVNVDGTLSLLQQCVKHKVRRFVFSSSCSVYGEPVLLPVSEQLEPSPLSPYALHKLIGEQYCALFSKLYGLETVCLRYFNVYGPRQNPSGAYAGVIPKFTTLFLQQKQPIIFGDGSHTRDFVYVSDVVYANVLAATSADAVGKIINVGSARETSVLDVAKRVKELLHISTDFSYGPEVIEPKASRADISHAKKNLGWEPKTQFSDGLFATVLWYQKNFKK